ncbi:Phox-like protein, partial [Fistulina hepatica ATCC 64428]
VHPWANSKNHIQVIHDDHIDIEEEIRLYEELCHDDDAGTVRYRPPSPSYSMGPPSIFSKDIILDDHSGESTAFARDVQIAGWTSVGDKGGAYVVYDCVIKTKEGTDIHVHKRYSEFEALDHALKRSLPTHMIHYIPTLPPKAPLSRFHAPFLARRRRELQYWLAAVLLHPDIGGCKAVRTWVVS